jgi:hypothetical protein
MIARRFSHRLALAAPVFVHAIVSSNRKSSTAMVVSDRMPDFLAPSLRFTFLRFASLII